MATSCKASRLEEDPIAVLNSLNKDMGDLDNAMIALSVFAFIVAAICLVLLIPCFEICSQQRNVRPREAIPIDEEPSYHEEMISDKVQVDHGFLAEYQVEFELEHNLSLN
ncbi:unnamed protein product [Clavelina lepadiformis]|uniref:Uncharacterized protein n=1 Tax=Clavelina lepadiformis TaxID=159417 RepID=A0ABP0FRR7_CLALP